MANHAFEVKTQIGAVAASVTAEDFVVVSNEAVGPHCVAAAAVCAADTVRVHAAAAKAVGIDDATADNMVDQTVLISIKSSVR